jgi:protein-disulfide isomerase
MIAGFRASFTILAAGLALALAACGGKDSASAPAANEPPKSEPIAAIAPPAGQKWAETASETELSGVVVGNPDAPVKLVEYASHTCPHCADFSAEAATPLRDKYIASGVVSYELRNQIHDTIDLTVAMLARCNGPASFQPLAEQVWANLPQIVQAARANGAALDAAGKGPEATRYQAIAKASGLTGFFAARGLPEAKAMQCLADPAKATAIFDRSNKQSDELDVEGTPTFFINGRNIGTQTWQTLEPMLQNAGAR